MLVIGEGSLALAASVVLGVGAATVGTIGTVAEFAVKEIDKEKRPLLRTIGEVFAKTLQNGSAAFALAILGSIVTAHPLAISAFIAIGVVSVLTPTVHELLKQTKYENLKRFFASVDGAMNLTSKAINTAWLTAAVGMAAGIVPALIAGIGLSALSLTTLKKA